MARKLTWPAHKRPAAAAIQTLRSLTTEMQRNPARTIRIAPGTAGSVLALADSGPAGLAKSVGGFRKSAADAAKGQSLKLIIWTAWVTSGTWLSELRDTTDQLISMPDLPIVGAASVTATASNTTVTHIRFLVWSCMFSPPPMAICRHTEGLQEAFQPYLKISWKRISPNFGAGSILLDVSIIQSSATQVNRLQKKFSNFSKKSFSLVFSDVSEQDSHGWCHQRHRPKVVDSHGFLIPPALSDATGQGGPAKNKDKKCIAEPC